MEGVVSILADPFYQMVETLWREVDKDCGLQNVKPSDIPHFSWHVAETYHEQKLASILEAVCAETQPFMVRTAGLGMFTAEKCVLYISLITNQKLLRFHKRLWESLKGVGEQVSLYYAPGMWVPHITLASEGLGEMEASCAVRNLACKPVIWEIPVDHLAVIGEAGLGSGKNLLRFPFGGQ